MEGCGRHGTVAEYLAPSGAKTRQKTDVARMVAVGVLQPGTRIVLAHRGEDYWAEVGTDGRIRLEATGMLYNKVDDAGCIVRGSKTCDGMLLWCVPRGNGIRDTLRSLRDKAREDNIM
jgi:hypothetical protein